MTAVTVPDPRFRDQLAEVVRWIEDASRALEAATVISERMHRTGRVEGLNLGNHDRLVGQVERIRAGITVVEARVQAAADQRAVEELRDFRARLAAGPPSIAGWIRSLDARAAALASPAPAPQTGGGQ